MAESLFISGGGGGGVGASGLTFTNYFPNDPAKGVYTDWTAFMAAVAEVPLGSAPVFTIACVGVPFVVPLAGMPVSGWDFRGGMLRSFYRTTGLVQLDLPTGVKFDNLFGIDNGLVLVIAPAAGTGVLEFTALPAGAPRLFACNDGTYIRNNGLGAFLRSKGDQPGGTTHIFVTFSAAFAVADPPLPAGAVLVFLSNDGGQEDDGIVAVQGQSSLGGLPDGWLANNNLNAVIVRVFDSSANVNTENLAVWVPAFTGTPVFTFPIHNAVVLAYTAGAPANWVGPAPTNANAAIDRLAAAVAGLLGGPIP